MNRTRETRSPEGTNCRWRSVSSAGRERSVGCRAAAACQIIGENSGHTARPTLPNGCRTNEGP
ncbi:MAG: hypothetical protein D6725_04865 [Planctomycetota bacterium]|nr:MAG: hypothetical protein D6725_04865 [Planctomycetota bacterium]